MKIKKFDQALHDMYDPPARAAVSAWVKMKWNVDAKDNPNKYGTDLLLYKNGNLVGYAEVEVRRWNPCPYTTIHVPARKKQMLEVPKTLFFALCQDMRHAYWIMGNEVFNFETMELMDEYKHEAYYDVPKELFNYVDLTAPF